MPKNTFIRLPRYIHDSDERSGFNWGVCLCVSACPLIFLSSETEHFLLFNRGTIVTSAANLTGVAKKQVGGRRLKVVGKFNFPLRN